MPRGDNPNSRANLKPLNTRTKKEQRKVQKKGGKASGESRKALGTWKSAYTRTLTDEDLDAILAKVKEMARRGNLNALDRLLKISGEDVSENTADNDQIRAFLDALKNGGDADD